MNGKNKYKRFNKTNIISYNMRTDLENAKFK